MELTITPPPSQQQQQLLLSMRYLRKLFRQIKACHVILVIFCAFFGLYTCEPCLMNGMPKSAENGCESYGDDRGMGFKDIAIADTNLGYAAGNQMTHIESICTDSHSFCFPSTLPGFLSEEQKPNTEAAKYPSGHLDGLSSVGSSEANSWATNKSWSSNYGIFQLLNGRTVSCSLNSREGVDDLSSIPNGSTNQSDLSSCRGPLLTQRSASFRLEKNSEMVKSTSVEVSPSPNVAVSPATLDWGQRHLYVPAIAFLTVENTCNDSILHVYEPFSTNMQFYPCNFSEVLLRPGEVASICFVFLPRWLGKSSAHLILQTSFGGFLVHVKGYAVQSPYDITPLVSLDNLSRGQLIKNLSLFNPSEEILHVKEVSAWVMVSQGNVSRHTEITCSLDNFQESDELSDTNSTSWLAVESGQVSLPLMAMRPHVKWEIGPRSRGTIIEMDFALELEGSIFGAFCMQFSSKDKADTVMLPFEIDLFGRVAYEGVAGLVSVSLEAVMPGDASNADVVAVSLRNGGHHILSVVKITQVAAEEVFQIKYIQGLLLFPGSITRVATVSCSQMLAQLHDSPPELSSINKNCKLVVLTNDSRSPLIEIPCVEIIQICFRYKNNFQFDHKTEGTESGSGGIGSWGSNMQLSSPIKAAEADEFVLGNWKSQGTTDGLSVLDDREILFPMVQVGTHCSKWISVKNPSEQPVVMQLILNSGEIIDECRDTDSSTENPSSGVLIHSKLSKLTKYGFSIAEGGQVEAYVHPYGMASLGPILFHPSNRCGWRSSALVRNNLSGVEWLSLSGFGGSLSLVLLQGSEPVQSIDFDLNLSIPQNISPTNMIFHMEEMAHTCSLPLSKELYAKNMGDLPLEVKRIDVSGGRCGLDGFTVRSCHGFSLAPGESTKLLISYQTDFSTAMVHRDLELALTSGILVIPVRAALPLYMFNLCKKSVFWMRLKRLSAAVIVAVSLMLLLLCCLFPQAIAFWSQDYIYRNEKRSINSGKFSRVAHKHRSSKFSMTSRAESLLRSVGEEKTSEHPVSRYPDGEDSVPKQGIKLQTSTPAVENHNQPEILSFSERDKALSSLLSKSVTVDDRDALDTSQPSNLTVRTGKEKGRRRRRRKGVGAGLAGLLEVASSQSGNSTPSSPLSPSAPTAANRESSPSSDIEARNPFSQVAETAYGKAQVIESAFKSAAVAPKTPLKYWSNNCSPASQEQPSVPSKASSSSVVLPFSTLSSAGGTSTPPTLRCSSPLASTSAIAPHARAPGSKLYDQKNVQEKGGDEYTYDIWGDHFSGLHLGGESKDVTTVKKVAVPSNSNSNSFFVSGPQALMTKMRPESVNCSRAG
ncbi:hypothetical protein Tsubulata_017079 [Turnera subulata]|uniref:Transmembrane protein 131-like N-terminal domain-containing protein n=1 Tax=Turnera subulata TaxID=218843 RepID=A0A9Q0JMC1_9ROSI|nr:hypothetical protein Tsubulata_017079 [Turnera subulata]